MFNDAETIDDEFYEELEEVLIMGDIGVNATEEIIARLKEDVISECVHKPAECKALLIRSIWKQMSVDEAEYKFEEEQSIVMVIGVNGVGKTTTIGKLASKLKSQGKKVIISAADTFRAAATEQLEEWAKRAGVEMISAHEGADPASVVYDSVASAKAKNADVLLIDTAGRLHNKKNLMAELEKMNRIIDREFPNAHRENLIVLDATTGQNALNQAKGIRFGSAAYRHCCNENGRYRKRRNRCRHPVRTACSRKIHRCRREHRRLTEIQRRTVRGCVIQHGTTEITRINRDNTEQQKP